MLRHTLKFSLLALGLAAAAPLAAQTPTPMTPRPMREWAGDRPGRPAEVNGPRRRHRRMRHLRRARVRQHARMRARAMAGYRFQRRARPI